MSNKFPVYKDHADAVCLECGGSGNGVHTRTDNAPGRGEWQMYCMKCRAFTWYDLRTLSQVLESQGITTVHDSMTDTDGRRAWYDRDGKPMGRFDVGEGWKLVESRGW